jgi:hypothetical protein
LKKLILTFLNISLRILKFSGNGGRLRVGTVGGMGTVGEWGRLGDWGRLGTGDGGRLGTGDGTVGGRRRYLTRHPSFLR